VKDQGPAAEISGSLTDAPNPRADETGLVGYIAYFHIDLDVNAIPIAGHITSDKADRRPFHGWLELSTAIEQRRTEGLTTPGRASRPAAPLPCEPGGQSRSFHRRGVGPWLARCNQPRWMLLGAWTCAGWSAIAVPVLAATRHSRVVAWWALGLVAMLVLLVFLWTEQQFTVDPDDRDEGPGGSPPPPSRDRGSSGIDRHCIERVMLARATQWPAATRPGRRSRNAAGPRRARPGI